MAKQTSCDNELDQFISELEDELYEIEVDNQVYVADLLNNLTFEEE